MRIGIDGSDANLGGGLAYVMEVLRVAEPLHYGIRRVFFWGGANSLQRIPDRPWLEKIYEPQLDRSFLARRLWQSVTLGKRAQNEGCDLLLCPGASYGGAFRPFVAMSHSFASFQWANIRRLGVTLGRLSPILVRWYRQRTLQAASGMIYPSGYEARTVGLQIASNTPHAVIPYGVGGGFFAEPRPQRRIENCSNAAPFRILHVSTVTACEYQWSVVEAVARLRREGLPVTLDIVGPAYRPARKRLRRAMGKADPGGMFIRCLGEVRHSMLSSVYRHAELFVCGSGCENMPHVLLEAMASGLPIVCSTRGALAEMLGKAGLYFDPESCEQMIGAMRELIRSRARRKEYSALAFRGAGAFRWERCAHDLFSFLAECAAREAENDARHDGICRGWAIPMT
ncbi:MAG: glycosyltransferase [Syntrophobacteraceae bacterium]